MLNLQMLRDKRLLSLRSKATTLFKVRPFDAEYLVVYNLSMVIKYLCSALSMVTGYFYLDYLFGNVIEFAWVGAIIALVLIESMKYYLTPIFYNGLLKGKYLLSFLFGLVVVPVIGLSIFLSVQGITEISNKSVSIVEVSKDTQTVKLMEISDYYDNLIVTEQAKLESIITYAKEKNSLTWKTTTDQINRLEERVDFLINKKENELNEFKANNLASLSTEISKNESIVVNFKFITIITESILLLAFLFQSYYLYKTHRGNLDFRAKR
jgi:hypothetical protein